MNTTSYNISESTMCAIRFAERVLDFIYPGCFLTENPTVKVEIADSEYATRDAKIELIYHVGHGLKVGVEFKVVNSTRWHVQSGVVKIVRKYFDDEKTTFTIMAWLEGSNLKMLSSPQELEQFKNLQSIW